MAKVNVRDRNKNKPDKKPSWEYRFEIASVGGKRRQFSKGGFRTKREAEKAGAEALAKYNNAGTVEAAGSDMSYADLLDLWMSEIVSPNLSYNTNRQYKDAIRLHISPKLGHYMIKSLTHSAIQNFLNDKSKEVSKSYLQTMKQIIMQSIKYAIISKNIQMQNPTNYLTLPKYQRPVASDSSERPYTMEEVQEFITDIEGQFCYYPFMIALFTGLRIGEIFALTWGDVDFENRTLNICKTMIKKDQKNDSWKNSTIYQVTSPKTVNSNRTVDFGDTLFGILKKLKTRQLENELYYGKLYTRLYLDDAGNVITSTEKKEGEMRFLMRVENGNLYSIPTAYYHFRKFTKNNFKFHNLRHTHATMLIEKGVKPVEVQARLGHASIITTYDRYVDRTDAMREESVHAIENAWANRGQNKKKA